MKILIIDDEELFREDTAEMLRDRGHTVETAEDGETGVEAAEAVQPDVILCDIVMPGMDGIEVVEEVQERLPDCDIFMVTAHGTLDTAVEAFRKGAYDYLMKPVDFDELFEKLDRIEEKENLRREVQDLREEVSGEEERFGLVGGSEDVKEVRRLIEKVAPTDANVLIEGESGTGKELVARALHNQKFEAGRRFVPVNCAALSETLLESELFGHVEGAFTGATSDKEGLFEAADEGTLFLDEISEMPQNLQSKLLRAIENDQITRVGDTEPIEVSPRIVTASNQDCKQLVEDGEFRRDLFYRLNVMEIHISPLRERKEDIPPLIEHFVEEFNDEMNKNIEGVSEDALQKLMMYAWPGNVRELRNMIERAMILRGEGMLQLDDFPPEIWEGHEEDSAGDTLKEVVSSFERSYIKSVLQQMDGNREATAERLGIDRSTLYRKLQD
jgi:DNA-binding NtrC family response regulator